MTSTSVLCAPVAGSRDDPLSAYRLLALVALKLARSELQRIALATDEPDWRDIEAADHLDAAHELLARVSP